jgi:hypothetical protein
LIDPPLETRREQNERTSCTNGSRVPVCAVEGVERPALEVLTKASYHKEFARDPERQECFVPIDWAKTRPLSDAETGMLGNQNSVCAPKTPKWRHTVVRLKELFQVGRSLRDAAQAPEGLR